MGMLWILFHNYLSFTHWEYSTHTSARKHILLDIIPIMSPCCLLSIPMATSSARLWPTLTWTVLQTRSALLSVDGLSLLVPNLQETYFNNQCSMFTDRTYAPGPPLSSNKYKYEWKSLPLTSWGFNAVTELNNNCTMGQYKEI